MRNRFLASQVRSALLIVAMGASSAGAQTQTPSSPEPDAAALQQQVQDLKKELDQLRQQYEERLAALEAKLGVAGGAPQAPAPQAPEAPQAPQAPQAASNVFNPATSVIGNFLGAAGRNTVNPAPALEMRESEVSFQAVVDPYARADFFLSFGQDGVDLEEGFITFPTLPGGLLMKVGRTKAQFGKVNTLHSHVLPWADKPLVLDHLVGGEEGLIDSGISVSRLIPNNLMFLELTGEVNRGESGDVFQSQKRGDLGYVGRLRAYRDVTEASNLEFGASYARGHNGAGRLTGVDDGQFVTDLYGIDATLRWKPLRRAIYNSFLGRSELVWSRRDQPGGLQKAFGWYASGDYQFARRWFAGARYDRSAQAADASLIDSGQSLLLTYKPTEFSLVRGQYRRTRFAIGDTANEFLFQFLFAIGAHGAHPF